MTLRYFVRDLRPELHRSFGRFDRLFSEERLLYNTAVVKSHRQYCLEYLPYYLLISFSYCTIGRQGWDLTLTLLAEEVRRRSPFFQDEAVLQSPF